MIFVFRKIHFHQKHTFQEWWFSQGNSMVLGPLFAQNEKWTFFSENSQQEWNITFLRKSAYLGRFLLFLRKICYFGTHRAKGTKTNGFLGVFGSISSISAIFNKICISGRRNQLFRKKAIFGENCMHTLFLGVLGSRWPSGGCICLYRGSLYRDSLYRESLYRDSLYRDSLYRESLYNGWPVWMWSLV